jgi:hypothetical protein
VEKLGGKSKGVEAQEALKITTLTPLEFTR